MPEYTYEIIAVDERKRKKFFRLCKKRIALLKQHGFIEEAMLHIKSLKEIEDDLNELCQYD